MRALNSSVSFLALALASAGCSGEDAAAPPGPATPTAVQSFDPALGELPEGLALDGGSAFVGFAPTGRIERVELAGGARSPYGELPAPPANGFMTGLAFGPDGRLYAALVSPEATPAGGIYRLPAGGGAAELFASGPELAFPNGLAFDAAGVLYVTDSALGAVQRVRPDGSVQSVVTDPLLAGQKDFCGPDLNTFDIGANGIALGDGVIYVANNDKGSIVTIPLADDGTAGAPSELVPPDCDRLGGADGLALGADGSLFVAVNRQNRLVRVAPDASTEVIAEGGVLDFPASLALAGGELWVTSFALGAALAGGAPKPALVRLPLAQSTN
jgi:sugar lactone lactonase YvrE